MSGEEDALLPGHRRSSRGSNSDNTHSSGILVNRFIILALLVLLVLASVYYQSQVTSLQGELDEEEKTVHQLEQTVADHAAVIRRFNQSISNADVISRLSFLEQALNVTTKDLTREMHHLQTSVTDQLQTTLTELGTTVQEAKDDIARQVEKVKKDVDQYVITTQDQFSMENSFMVYQLAGTLTLLSCLISMWHMTAHLRKMQEPVVQRKILAILWMSPIYAVTSWFSLVFPPAEGYLAIIKDGYEAYIIYQFLSFCIAVLGKGDRGKVVDMLTKRADHLTPPFRLCFCCDQGDPYENNPRALADAILLQCQVFGMQFVFLRPLTTIANVVLAKLEYYGAGTGPQDYRSPQFYIAIVQNISIFTAFAGLLKFYHAVDEDLAWCRPFAKFLCIKGVVFMTFWQGLAITILAETTDVGGQESEKWAKSAQNFLICLEMLLFSIAHFYCFPTEEWDPDYRARASRGFSESLALGDFVQDLKLILQKSGKKKKKAAKKPTEPTVPEGNEDEGENDDDDDDTVRTTTSVASSGADLETALRECIEGAGEGDDDGDDDNNDADDSDTEENKAEVKRGLGLLEALSFSLTGNRAQSTEGDDPKGQPSWEAIEEEQRKGAGVATETTGLLEGEGHKSDSSSSDGEEDSEDDEGHIPRTKNEEVLSPSIFTTIAEIGREHHYK